MGDADLEIRTVKQEFVFVLGMPDAKAPGRHRLDAASSRRCTSRVPPETRTRACTMRKKGSSTTTRPAHVHTNAPSAPTGGGGGGGGDETIETTVGALPLWDVTAAAPKWAPPTSLCTKAGAKAVLEDARVAATIECARAGYLEKLRKMLNRLATQKGAGAPPPQAFERWRFAAKHAEDASFSIDPVIPNGDTEGGAAAFNALVDDLTRAGVSSSSAKAIASQLAEAAGRYARLCRRSQAVLASCQHPWTEESSRGGDDDSGDDSDASDDDDDDDDDDRCRFRWRHRMARSGAGLDPRRRGFPRAIGRAKVDARQTLRGALQARVRKVGGDVPTVRAGVGPGPSAGPPGHWGQRIIQRQTRRRRIGLIGRFGRFG